MSSSVATCCAEDSQGFRIGNVEVRLGDALTLPADVSLFGRYPALRAALEEKAQARFEPLDQRLLANGSFGFRSGALAEVRFSRLPPSSHPTSPTLAGRSWRRIGRGPVDTGSGLPLFLPVPGLLRTLDDPGVVPLVAASRCCGPVAGGVGLVAFPVDRPALNQGHAPDELSAQVTRVASRSTHDFRPG